MKYRKKPVVVEAFRFFFDPMPDWFNERVMTHEIILENCYDRNETDEVYCHINTLEGVMKARGGDYIIKGVKGEIYPCKAEIFEATYEQME